MSIVWDMMVSASLARKTKSDRFFLFELANDANGCDDDEKRVKRKFACHRFVVSAGKHHVNRNRSIKLHFSPHSIGRER